MQTDKRPTSKPTVPPQRLSWTEDREARLGRPGGLMDITA